MDIHEWVEEILMILTLDKEKKNPIFVQLDRLEIQSWNKSYLFHRHFYLSMCLNEWKKREEIPQRQLVACHIRLLTILNGCLPLELSHKLFPCVYINYIESIQFMTEIFNRLEAILNFIASPDFGFAIAHIKLFRLLAVFIRFIDWVKAVQSRYSNQHQVKKGLEQQYKIMEINQFSLVTVQCK